MLNEKGGFTLVELMIAVVILSVAVLGVAGSTGRLSVLASTAELRSKAQQAVDDRIALISLDPRYTLIDSIYEGTDSVVVGMPGFARSTTIDSVTVSLGGGNSITYQRVTVQVTGAGLPGGAARTVVLGAP